MLYDSSPIKLEKMQTNPQQQKTDQWLLVMGQERRRDGYVHGLRYGFMMYILYVRLLYVSYLSKDIKNNES